MKYDFLALSFAAIAPVLLPAAEESPTSVSASGPVNYSSAFQVEKGWNLFVTGEYLFWVPGAQDLYFAQSGLGTGSVGAPSSDDIDFQGKIKRVNPKWDSGFRVGLGATILSPGWDLYLLWTRFHTHTSKRVWSRGDNFLLPLWAHPDLAETSVATFAKGTWRLNLDLLDFEWGRSSWVGYHLSVRPFLGLRSAWIDQTLKNTYSFATDPILMGNLHIRSDFTGVGPRLGADIRFSFGWGISLYGLLSSSFLYGRFDTGFKEKENTSLIAKSISHPYRGVNTLQMAGGLRWDWHFLKERLHLGIHAGWNKIAGTRSIR